MGKITDQIVEEYNQKVIYKGASKRIYVVVCPHCAHWTGLPLHSCRDDWVSMKCNKCSKEFLAKWEMLYSTKKGDNK